MKYNDKIAPILESAQKVVISPSNIYTIDNPDVLFIASGNLFGLFIPMKSEIQNVDLLVRRIMVSRLAYVESMKTLLLSEDECFLNENFILLNQICHRILDNNANSFRSIFETNRFESNTPDIGVKIRTKQTKLYTRNFLIYQLGEKEKQSFAPFQIDKQIADRAVVESWSHSQVSVKDAYMIDDFLVTFKRKSTMTFKKAFNNLMTLSFFMNYTIHDGEISYKRTLEYPKMINSDFSFLRENDPYKYIRVLAFMGLLPIQVNSLDTCFGIKDKLKHIWQNRRNPQRPF